MIEKLLKYIVKADNGCWLWQGAKDRLGYGRISQVTYGESLAHRAIFRYAGHELGPKDVLAHSCDTPSCVNPEHLMRGTQLDNLRDARSKGRCSSQPKVSLELIKNELKTGKPQRQIASELGLSESYLSQIKHGTRRTYKHG